MTRALGFRYSTLSDVGMRRSENQDSGYASNRLLAIADGMGGAAAGDLASATAMEALREIDRDLDPEIDGDALDALTEATARANHRIGELIHDDPAVEGMGTTIDAMLWDGKRFAIAHIGDSRIYRLRDGQLEQITTDHTYVQSLVAEGRLSQEEARVHPHRSLLLRAVLGRDELDPEFWWEEPQIGDRYLLCSDGLPDMISDETIAETLAGENIDVIATELVRLALEAGGHDNVTVVLAEVVGADAEDDENLACADGRPQQVGAAAENPQPRTGLVSSSPTGRIDGSRPAAHDEDPEVLRYAPRPKPRFGWLRGLLVTMVILAGVGASLFVAWQWSQKQYFVGEVAGNVAIFRGVDATLPGLKLSHIDEVSDIEVSSLPTYHQQRIAKGIEVANRAEAAEIVANLKTQAKAPEPEPTVEPTKKPKPIKPKTKATP